LRFSVLEAFLPLLQAVKSGESIGVWMAQRILLKRKASIQVHPVRPL